MGKEEYEDITEVINEIADDINSILSDCEKERYFECIVLLYSFIENLLKWLVFIKLLWEKSDKVLKEEEVKIIRLLAKDLRFYDVLRISYGIKLIDLKLFKRLDEIRKERNNVVHQFWLYTHRKDRRVLRKKLEKLALTASSLIGIFNELTEEVGIDEVYQVFL
jgi:hypothetical protein